MNRAICARFSGTFCVCLGGAGIGELGTEMTRIVSGFGAALGSIVLLTSATIVQAQEQGTTTPAPADAPAGTAAPAPAPQTPPPATTQPSTPEITPPAPTTAAPSTATPPSTTTPPAAGQTPAPANGAAPVLPDVEIIQTQPAPAPEPPPDAPPAPPKVVKKKPPPVEPEPQPVVVQAKPKPEPQPAPQQVAEPAPQPAALPSPVGGPPAGDTLVKISPIAGSEIPLDKVPGAVGTVSAADVARNGSGKFRTFCSSRCPELFSRIQPVAAFAPMYRIAASTPHPLAGARKRSPSI